MKAMLPPKQEETPAENGTTEEGASALATELEEAGPINEDLFLDEDLEGLDDELNDLDMND